MGLSGAGRELGAWAVRAPVRRVPADRQQRQSKHDQRDTRPACVPPWAERSVRTRVVRTDTRWGQLRRRPSQDGRVRVRVRVGFGAGFGVGFRVGFRVDIGSVGRAHGVWRHAGTAGRAVPTTGRHRRSTGRTGDHRDSLRPDRQRIRPCRPRCGQWRQAPAALRGDPEPSSAPVRVWNRPSRPPGAAR